MSRHVKWKGLLILSIALTAVCCGCGKGVKKSPIFEGLDLKFLLIGSTRVGAMPALEVSEMSIPEYSFKDCELTLDVADVEQSSLVARIMSNCSNTVTRLGGTVVTNVARSDLSFELRYEAERKTGLIRLYATDLKGRQVKLIAIMLECPRNL